MKLCFFYVIFRAEKLNAVNVQLFADMANFFKKATYDEDVRSIVFSGKGRLFTAGK